MTHNPTPTTRTLIDNWLMEFAGRLISKDMDDISEDTAFAQYLNNFSSAYPYTSRYLNRPELLLHDKLISLLHLIDLLILNDSLIYNDSNQRFRFWTDFGVFSELESILNGSSLLYPATSLESSILDSCHYGSKGSSMFSDMGSLSYLVVAARLGVSYWPAPRRAEYLKNNVFNPSLSRPNFRSITNNFGFGFQQVVNREIRDIIENVYRSICQSKPFYFGGFSSYVLSNCDSNQSIIETVLQIRNTGGAKAFRHWLIGINNALEKGNVKKISSEMKYVHELFNEIKEEFGQSDDKTETVFEFGLSPTIQIPTNRIKKFFSKISRKPHHLIFLKTFVTQTLANANLRPHVVRLFPEYRAYSNLNDLPSIDKLNDNYLY